MKGTLAILGMLVAAYAAPLFGNEVPLILEETIQMPVVPEAWDVALVDTGTYVWVVGEGVYNDSFQIDSNAVYFVGNSVEGISDTFLVGPFGGSAAPGWPRYVEILRQSESSMQTVAMSSYDRGCSSGGETNITLYDIEERRAGPSVRLMNYCDRPAWMPGARCWCNFRFVGLASVPAYPEISSRITATKHYYTTELEDHTPSFFNVDIFQEDASTTFDANVWIGSFSQWASREFFAFVDNGQDFCEEFPPIECPFVRIYLVENGELIQVAIWDIFDQTLAECKALLCTWDEQANAALAILCTSDSLKAMRQGSGPTLWRIRYSIGAAVLGDAVPSLQGEELLIAEPQFAVLHIHDPRDFRFWGQTSGFEAGWDEFKIIGRYHNETRRLVVRYGSELRIYRFGEPIYTDADDARPELPQELALSAFPNPFNPTTLIAFDLPKAARASLSVFDLNGRLVQTLFDEPRTAGHSEIAFNGASLPSGIYFARLVAGDFTRTQKLVLLK